MQAWQNRVQHAGPLSSRPAQHRAHWTTQHKAKQMSNSIRRLRCRNVSKHSKCTLRSVSDTATQQFWSLPASEGLFFFYWWRSRHRGTHSQASCDLEPRPLSSCADLGWLQPLWSQNSPCLPSIVTSQGETGLKHFYSVKKCAGHS